MEVNFFESGVAMAAWIAFFCVALALKTSADQVYKIGFGFLVLTSVSVMLTVATHEAVSSNLYLTLITNIMSSYLLGTGLRGVYLAIRESCQQPSAITAASGRELLIYDVVSRDTARLFSITGGLTEGYGDTGQSHSLEEVVAAHHQWQATTGLVLGGLVSLTAVTYGWPHDGTIRGTSESGWKFEGHKNTLYDRDVSDVVFRDRLLSLASALAQSLGQVKVYVQYDGESFILKRPDRRQPFDSANT